MALFQVGRRIYFEMMPLWKKATSPTIEEAARDITIKRSLTKHLSKCVHDLQQELVNSESVAIGGENASNVCFCLEAIFIHGLKDTIAKKMSNVFNNSANERLPSPDFWPVAMVYTHKDVLAQLTSLREITTDIGRCRAWLRLALNESLLVSYVEAMIQDVRTLKCYYRPTAYMADSEQPDILKQFLDGLSGFSFQLPINCSVLNYWNPTPLQLAGVYKFQNTPEPVMPAVDVADFFQHESHQSRKPRSKLSMSSSRKVTASVAIQAGEPPVGSHGALEGAGGFETNVETASPLGPSALANPDVPPEQTTKDASSDKPTPQSDGQLMVSSPAASASSAISSAQVRELLRTLNLDVNEGAASDRTGSPASVPDIDAMDRFPHEPRRSFGNVLDPSQGGWSCSPFEEDTGASDERSDASSVDSLEPQSYDSLVLSYTQNISQNLSGTPEMRDLITSAIRTCNENQAS